MRELKGEHQNEIRKSKWRNWKLVRPADVNYMHEIPEDELDSAIFTTAGERADGARAWIMPEFDQILKPRTGAKK